MEQQEDANATKLFDIGSSSMYFSKCTTTRTAAYCCAVMVGESVIQRMLTNYLLPPGVSQTCSGQGSITVNIFGLRTKIVTEFEKNTGNNQKLHIDHIPKIYMSAPTFNEILPGHACIVPLLEEGCDLIVVNGSHLEKWLHDDDAVRNFSLHWTIVFLLLTDL